MKNFTPFLFCIVIALLIAGCSTIKNGKTLPGKYEPGDEKLYNTIIYQDSIFFEAYNTCTVNLEKYAGFYGDSIEFYHDQGGLMNNKQEIVEATKKNVCGRVTRELVKGSIEVYPIKNYGAVEIGFHKFHNNTEKAGTPSNEGRFVIVWQNKNDKWKITRVISLH